MLTVTVRRRVALASLLAGLALVASSLPANAAGSSPAPSPSTSASPSAPVITFGIGPATKGKVDRRANFNMLLTKGAVSSDQVALVNLTYEPLTLNLYASDAINTPDGSLSLAAASAEPEDAAKWVSLKTPTGEGYVVVKPRSTLVVPFTVKVPKAAFVGDHLAGIVASTVTRGQTPGDRSTDVEFEQRIAVRLAVRVAGELKPQLTIENLSAAYAGTLNPVGNGTATVTYTVRNTGNVRLGGSQLVEITSPFGQRFSAGTLPDVPLLLPGGSATVSIPVRDVPALGLMTATVTVTPLAAAGDANPAVEVATASVRFWAVPWLGLGLLLLLVLLLLWLGRRRRRAKAAAPVGAREMASAGTSV